MGLVSPIGTVEAEIPILKKKQFRRQLRKKCFILEATGLFLEGNNTIESVERSVIA